MPVEVIIKGKEKPSNWTPAQDVPIGFFIADNVRWDGPARSWGDDKKTYHAQENQTVLFCRRGDVIVCFDNRKLFASHFGVGQTTEFLNVRVPSDIKIEVTE